MTSEKILKKAIHKAVKNGWNINGEWVNFIPGYRDKDYMLKKLTEKYSMSDNWKVFIFSHDFAKAFWGNEPEWMIEVAGVQTDNDMLTNWQYHLQEMVLKEDPVKYLEEFLSIC